MINKIKEFYKDVYIPKRIQSYTKNELNSYFKTLGNIPSLTKEEEQAIKEYWSRYGLEDYSTDSHKILYHLTGIRDPKFMSSYLFYLHFKKLLNDSNMTVAWSDKNYLDFFLKDISAPNVIIRNVSGRFLDHDFNVISKEKANKILQDYPQIVIKPTTLTSTGHGVDLLTNPFNLDELDKKYKKDYSLQLPLKLHNELKKLSKTAVNTIRVNTILIEDKAYSVSALIKSGEEGKFADNQGTKRYFIGIDDDAKLRGWGVTKKLERIEVLPNGFKFEGMQIPEFDKVLKIAEDAHLRFPHFAMVFWDIVLQENGEPAILEANLRGPDMMFNQAALGPFFGKHTELFMDYYMELEKRLS